ncbi:P-loop containing nucleoside triphosphate hydrolase protein [Aspergillus varians]
MVNFIKKHLKGTKLIFVVGCTGSGKTTLLGEITGQDLKIGNSAKSGTLGHQLLPAVVHGERYLFVDTAGFGAADLDDREVFEDIMSCVCMLGEWVTVVGVMFVHDARQQRLTQSEMRTIHWLQCFCGPQFFRNITIVTTQWDRLTNEDMDQARDIAKELEESAFADILLSKYVTSGRTYYHGVNIGGGDGWDALSKKGFPEERSKMAADFVQDTYGLCDGVPRLQVLEELAIGWGLYETQAAASLFNTYPSSTICILRYKAVILDVDKKLRPKQQQVELAVSAPKPPQEEPTAEISSLKWWEIAKEVAWTFWGFQRTGTTKFTDYRRGTPADVWVRLKTWWSGETPPQ